MPSAPLPAPEHIRTLARAHRPGYAMGQQFYTDPAVFETDARLVFGRHWMLAGHVSEIPAPGDFLLFEMMGESVILCRDEGGTVRAFANVCRHRGSRVCNEARGTTRRFTCPYHAWTYGLDGSLISARLLDASHDRARLGLLPVSVEVLEGLIYVSLDPAPPDFGPARAALTPCLAPFGLSQTRIAHRASYPVAANWKLLVENYNECYHCAPAHPEYSRGHTLQHAPDRTEAIHADFAARAPGVGDGLCYESISALGPDAPAGAEGFAHYRTALAEGHVTGSRDGQPVAPLLGMLTSYDGGAADVYLGFLNPMLIYPDHAVLYRFLPVDAAHSVQEVIWLVRADAEEGRDYDRAALTWLWDVTTEADKRIVEDNQRGVASRFYRPGPLVGMEAWLQLFIDTYLGLLQEDGR